MIQWYMYVISSSLMTLLCSTTIPGSTRTYWRQEKYNCAYSIGLIKLYKTIRTNNDCNINFVYKRSCTTLNEVGNMEKATCQITGETQRSIICMVHTSSKPETSNKN